MIQFCYPGNPKPCTRPRVANGQAYNDPAYTRYKKDFATYLHALGLHHCTITHSEVHLKVVFYRATKQRVDLDNLLKTVLDVLQDARVIENDNQVDFIAATKLYDKERPRTEVVLEIPND